jgi:hypothetical protein
MSWLRDLIGSPLAYPNLFGTKGLVVVVVVVVIENIMKSNKSRLAELTDSPIRPHKFTFFLRLRLGLPYFYSVNYFFGS